MPLVVEIITPDQKVYSSTADSVIVPASTGQLGILPGHIPLLAMIEPGAVQIEKNQKTTSIAVSKGFIQVASDKVSILTEAAIDVNTIDLQAVTQAKKRAQEALEAAKNKKDIDLYEVQSLESIIHFSLAQEHIKEKH